MPDPKMRLGFREPDVDTNLPFVEGTVKVEGFELEIVPFRGPDSVDAWDASFGGLMQTKGAGEHPFVSIPAYPNRKFRLQYIFVNNAADTRIKQFISTLKYNPSTTPEPGASCTAWSTARAWRPTSSVRAWSPDRTRSR